MAFKEEVQSSTIQNINCDKALRWDGGVSENHQKCWLAAHWLPALLKSQHGKKGCCVPSVRCSSSGTDLPLLWPLSYTQTLHLQLQLRHILAKSLGRTTAVATGTRSVSLQETAQQRPLGRDAESTREGSGAQ